MTFSGKKLLILPLLSLLLIHQASCQNSFFKFKIKEEGIYRIRADQAQSLGVNSLSEVVVYGYPGILPQLLQSENLELQQVPGMEKDGDLYFYLTSPHNFETNEDGIKYSPNPYSDSISFLIGTSKNARRITTVTGKSGNLPAITLYEWSWLQEQENNILNSGRSWYSRSVAPGITRGYPVALKTKSADHWRLVGKLMGRATTLSKINLAADDLILSTSSINGIPSSAYGIKGQEIQINERFLPKDKKVDRLRISFQSATSGDAGYFEYIGFGVPHSSSMLEAGVFSNSQKSSFRLSTLSNLTSWEVGDFFNPKAYDLSQGSIVTGEKFIVFDEAKAKEISQIKPANLSLRVQSSWPSLLIITPEKLRKSAERLRLHKIGMGIYSETFSLEDIYDAFGYGNSDINAIRNFIAWHYHQGGALQNVLILGKGTFDYRRILGGRPNLVPIYTSRNSLNPLTTFSSDDYFALLEFGQGMWEENSKGDELMQIGVGRLPVVNVAEANIVVDKIINYENNSKAGEWKKTVTFFADDGDNNIHLRDSESLSGYLNRNHQEFKQVKLYLDKFEQEINGGNQSSAHAKDALEETLTKGTLLLNYIGHGNETTLTAEEVFLTSAIENWPNQDQLALWMSATCEFGRHDSPFIRSAAEELLIAPNKGAIGLLSTGRPVFSSVNFSLNEAFIGEVFRLENGQTQDLGSIFRNTKNKSLNGSLNRNFSLLADPSMRLSSSDFQIKITTIKDPDSQRVLDTLSAFQEVLYEAEVVNPVSKGTVTNFNGNYTIQLNDKPLTSKTFGDESTAVEFKEENNILFKGTGKIVSGLIKGKMLIPKNIDLTFGEGNIRMYGQSQDHSYEAFGFTTAVIGGTTAKLLSDNTGPSISAAFGGKDSDLASFPSSSITMEAFFSDSSGINISGIKASEILTIQINENAVIPINTYFEAKNSSFTSGKVNFRLADLKEGKNLVTIKAWDNFGNSSAHRQEINVIGSDRLRILTHKTYPNPTQIESRFELEHNQPGENLILTLAVYQTDGKILFTESERLVKAEGQIEDLSWSFLQNQSVYPVKGSYIYKLTLQSERDNSTDSVSGLIILQ